MSHTNRELARFATTDHFNKWRRLMRHVFIDEHKISSTTSRRLCELLDALESFRIAYCKGERIFETKRVSSEELGELIGVTGRRVRDLMRLLEKLGYVGVMRKRFGIRKNFRNRYVLKGFKSWLSAFTQAIPQKFPSNQDSDLKSLITIPKGKICFPEGRTIGRFWKTVAYEVHEMGEEMPCLAELSDKFRANLLKHKAPRNAYNIIRRWKNFVRVALDFGKRGQAA